MKIAESTESKLEKLAERVGQCEAFDVENGRLVLGVLRMSSDRHGTTQKQIDVLTMLINCQRGEIDILKQYRDRFIAEQSDAKTIIDGQRDRISVLEKRLEDTDKIVCRLMSRVEQLENDQVYD